MWDIFLLKITQYVNCNVFFIMQVGVMLLKTH